MAATKTKKKKTAKRGTAKHGVKPPVSKDSHPTAAAARAAGTRGYVNIYLPPIVVDTMKHLAEKRQVPMTVLFEEALAKKEIPKKLPRTLKEVEDADRKQYRAWVYPAVVDEVRAATIKLFELPKEQVQVNWATLAEHMILAYLAKKRMKLKAYKGKLPRFQMPS